MGLVAIATSKISTYIAAALDLRISCGLRYHQRTLSRDGMRSGGNPRYWPLIPMAGPVGPLRSNPVGGQGGRWRQQLDHRPQVLQRKSFCPPQNAEAATVDTPRATTVRHVADIASSAKGTAESPVFGTGIVDVLVLGVSFPRHPKLALQACVRRHGTCRPGSAGHGTSCSARSKMGFNRRIDRDFLRLCSATTSDWHHACPTSP